MVSRSVMAGEVPRGFLPYAELAQAQAKAKTEKKLLAVVSKGDNDSCPHCASALESGTKAVHSDCVFVFARVADLRAKADTLPAKLKDEAMKASDGASVYFYVFDPDLGSLIAKADREQLDNNKTATREFKKTVEDAHKAAKTAK
jgi:hypothetical protein